MGLYSLYLRSKGVTNIMKKVVNVVILYLMALISGVSAYAAPGRLGYILNHPDKFDRKVVTVEGEAIGNLLNDNRGGVWLNIFDAGYNIGIYAHKKAVFKDVNNFGAYAKRGDIIEVKGIFYKNCPLHAERDIHAVSVKIVRRGYALRETVSGYEKLTSFALSIICLTLAAIYFIKLEYARRH
ncbi:MAG: hypothetical protein B1H08_05195 [Candidatus Omnitrophica bacterium 4484_171]|nr:MAG: hypothetical protein B1H08_05195 [Candidatus Omnitrophica bacterium 4484_171]